MKKILLTGILMGGFFSALRAQESYWRPSVTDNKLDYPAYGFTVNSQTLLQTLHEAGNSKETAVKMLIPTPGGERLELLVWKNSLLPEALQAKFPEVLTFDAIVLNQKGVSAKLDYNTYGFHVMVYDGDRTFFINPTDVNTGAYAAFYKGDAKRVGAIMPCENTDEQSSFVAGAQEDRIRQGGTTAQRTNGNTRKTYRLALSCTGEYAEAVAGANPTKAAVFSAMTTSMNRVNGIYERELSVTMQFIANNDTLVYTNPTTDPFTANNNGDLLLGQNQSNTTSKVGNSNYDIGHIFSTGGGGIALLEGVCITNLKARGVTGRPNPVGDPFDVDYVSHEMGHQFGANHTFNICTGTENQSTAYEPGSGSTIMAYAGICGSSNNLQNNSDAYFHSASLNEIGTSLSIGSASTCGVATAGIASPSFTIDNIPDYYIPKKTPFEFDFPTVTAGNTDSRITYSIEQYNLGNYQENESGASGFNAGPSFRNFIPDTVAFRSFPNLAMLKGGFTSQKGQRLSDVARNYNFKFTAREVKDGWGAINLSDATNHITVVATPRPFGIIYPNVNDSIIRNSATTIYWDQAHTGGAPINCNAVNIYLSLDTGNTFPIILAQDVPNTGSAIVTIPDVASTTARVKVKASNNIFFSMSRRNVVIGTVASPVPVIDTTTGIKQLNFAQGVSIFPNPASDKLNIVLNKEAIAGGVQMVNILGQAVWADELTTQNKEKTISVSHLSKGIYYIRFVNKEGSTYTQKITLQ
ncbi:hypothetical protein DBR32_04885 [Taibaiella sp. KBW10]|uniref:zinc-dependent metalloprotease n=1 Tax=Taibaiella sp. KBW10 TaxID=2153357 RepID=UPI000F5A9717|nr:zinc-dependent metalloprotease family protein [Taibaiella sp. KBW10]RQO31302.1 hypothetical protein DBR32_04885 [Taibaiella sp. KBW10]